jgi:hypothetical protein
MIMGGCSCGLIGMIIATAKGRSMGEEKDGKSPGERTVLSIRRRR